jgi:hypothetical protein
MQGHLFWLLMVGGVLDQVLAIRARSLSCNGRDIFRRSQPETHSGAVNAGWKTVPYVRNMRDSALKRY